MLPIVAVLSGILTTLVIRRTTNAAALRENRRKIYARLLEFRLFFDEPGLIWRAQLGLLQENARLLKLLLVPSLILVLPMTWLFRQLDSAYGFLPLRPGEPAVVTAQLTRPIETTDRFALQGTDAVSIETPPIRVFHDNQVTWRIRLVRGIDAAIVLTINGRPVAPQRLSPPQARARHPDREIAWLEVEYPEATGFWMVWFAALATAAALLSARWTGNQVN
jgi:hypothetical protein